MTASDAEVGAATPGDEGPKRDHITRTYGYRDFIQHRLPKPLHACLRISSGKDASDARIAVTRYFIHAVLLLGTVGYFGSYLLPNSSKQAQRAAGVASMAILSPPPDWREPDTLPHLTFSGLGVKHHTFVGSWNKVNYQATLWARYACTGSGKARSVRVVLTINRAPYLQLSQSETHAVLPAELGSSGKLPRIAFKATDNTTKPTEVEVNMQAWEQLLKKGWQTAAFVGNATLPAGRSYILTMEGSERSYPLLGHYCTKPHEVFTPHSAWVGVYEKLLDRPPAVLEFLQLQHLRHHLKLGFDGVVWIVRPGMLEQLKKYKEVVDAVNATQLVLISWEYGVVPHIGAYMQVPGYNLLRLAMHGVQGVALGLWDVDEYLLLPQNRSVKEEIKSGCLQQVFQEEAEAVLPISWTAPSPRYFTEDAEYKEWMKHGGMAPALHHMQHKVHDIVHCKYGIYCKALVNPAAPYNFYVHQFTRPGPEEQALHRTPVPFTCAYVLHFYQLWHRREIWDMTNTRPAALLRLQDMPGQ